MLIFSKQLKLVVFYLLTHSIFLYANTNNISPIISYLLSDTNQSIQKPIHPLFDEFNVGFGGSSYFPFSSKVEGNKIWMSAKDLVLNEFISDNTYYAHIKEFNATAFSTVQKHLKKSKFFTLWFYKGWQESGYSKSTIQALMDAGHIPVFNYWYFGDKLILGMPDEAQKEAYRIDNLRVATFLSELNGTKMLIMEPEFNKKPVIVTEESQNEFSQIISQAIDTIKAENSNILFSLSMTDTGSRASYKSEEKCGYTHCALGDKYAWEQPSIVYNNLLDKLDFISFQQSLGQFTRDPSNLGDWNNPNPRAFSDEDIGINFTAKRISNFSKFLHEKYKKPIYLPSILIATATWQDENNNSKIEVNEVAYNGWVDKANDVYQGLAELRGELKSNGLFGFSPMALFDNPRHDYGGYQYLMNNEYHLGLIGSSAIDETDIAPYGDLQFKGEVLSYIFSPDTLLDDDNDTLPNGWEEEHGLDPKDSSNALADSDGDGYTDVYEYLHGTNPSDISDTPTLAIALLSSTGNYPNLNSLQHQSLNSHIKLQEPEEIRVHVVSSNWIRLSLMPKRSKDNKIFEREPLDVSKVEDTSLYTLIDENNQTLTIDKVGFKRRTVYAPLRVSDLRISENIFIHVVEDLTIGETYTLEVNSTLSGSLIQEVLSFEPHTQLSDTLHISPYGFRPEDKKKAYLGISMGSAGELEPKDLSFEVVRMSDNTVVYEGVGILEGSVGWRESFANEPYSYVYELDFSSLNSVDEYYLRHSTGISQPFSIHSDAYRNAMNTLALGMYHQRRGEALLLPYTRFTHLSTIEDETYVYDSSNLDSWLLGQHGWGEGIKYPSTLEGQKVDISGGHMDAGDYSPYTYNSAMTAWTMISTIDTFADRVAHDNFGVPQSGDGVSDLLQEFLIEIHWLKDMQDSVDGGVFGMSKPKDMHYQYTMPGEMALTRYLAPKDTTVTGGYIAALARSARSPILQKHDKALADLLKARAIKAWEWLDENEGMHGYHHYGKASPDATDEGHEHARAWAAIELYALTGKEKYHDSFMAHHKPLQRNNGVEWMNAGYGYTTRTLALWDRNKVPYAVDEAMKNISIERFHGDMDNHVRSASETPYDLIVNRVIKRWNIVGWYFPVSTFSWDLLIAYELYGNPEYLELAQDQIHFTLGANPSNMTYITGMGYKRLRSTVDQESRFDGIDAPVVGLPMSPMVTGYSWSNVYARDISNYTYPRDNPDENGTVYGILETAYDGWNVAGEFTIEKMAGMLSVLAILTPKSNEIYTYPKFTLSVDALGNGEYKPSIHFEEEIPHNYSVLWYENDNAVSIDSEYILKQDFTKPIWKLSAEVLTLEGRRWYDEMTINTRDYNNTNIPLKAFEDNSSDTIFHFDNTPSDSNDILNTLTLYGNTHFSEENLNWLHNPMGSALRLDGFGDEVKTTFNILPYLEENKSIADISQVSIEGLFYFDSLGPINQNVLHFFYFMQSWGNGLQITRYNWTKDIRVDFGKTQHISEEINDALSLHSWHYIQMLRTKTHDILKIDGKELVKVAHDAVYLFDYRDIILKFGNFHGWVDEMRLDVKF